MPKLLLLHIPMFALTYVMLLAVAVTGLFYILQERQIKQHHWIPIFSRLPSLETMEHFIYRMIFYSFSLLTVGILLGSHWQFMKCGRFWGWDPTETFSLTTWIIYALYLTLRWGYGLRGRKSTYLALTGFGILLLALVAFFFFSPLHPSVVPH